MKKIMKKISMLVVALNCLVLNICYADEIDPMYPITLTKKGIAEEKGSFADPVEIIIAGLVLVVIGLVGLYFWIKKYKVKKQDNSENI